MWKDTLLLRAWAAKNVAMIAYVRPRVESVDDQGVAIRVPLTRRTRNHLRSMYFGALQVGADLAGGYLALRHARRSGQRVSFVFKAAEAEFLRRPERDVVFRCAEGDAIRGLVEKAIQTGERHHLPVHIEATCADVVVARFCLTLSVRAK